MTAITETPTLAPGVHDLPVDAYHRLPHLSSTGIRKLVPPSTPAHFRQWLDDPEEHKRVFDFGHAAHRLVLGAGMDFEVVDPASYTLKDGSPANDWRAASVAARVAEVRAEGRVPLRVADGEAVAAMAAALTRHPRSAQLFDIDRGHPEQTLIWTDEETGVPCRALVDWLDLPGERRLILKDYKSSVTAERDAFARKVETFGYHIQMAHYRAGAIACGLHDDPAALLIAQEKTPPYLVSIVELHPDALALGAAKARDAIRLYADCAERDRWPGYGDDIQLIDLPRWAYTEDL